MDKYSEQDRRTVIGWFPNLQHDANFEITSDCTPAYNCIAWALGMNDVWVGLNHPSNYSLAWWPNEVPCDERTESLVALFEHFGFEVTNDPNPEDEYDKVALLKDMVNAIKGVNRNALEKLFWAYYCIIAAGKSAEAVQVLLGVYKDLGFTEEECVSILERITGRKIN